MTQIDSGALAERAYRAIDRRLFGKAPTLSWDATGSFRVTVEGRPLTQVEDAVRERLGQPGATVRAEVWRDTDGASHLIFVGHCALDHRSLARSVAWVQAKLPALLQAARARLQCDFVMKHSMGAEPGEPRSAGALIGRLASEVIGRLRFRDQWLIQLHAAPEKGPGVGRLLAAIEPPPDRFWADPFLCRRDQRLWLFIEELPFGAANAHLSAVEIDDEGRLLGTPRAVLAESWHLSYPFLWEQGDRLFMIPEASANSSVDLYECLQFPFEWCKRSTLIEGASHADATVVQYLGKLWMFSAGRVAGGSLYDELHLHSADRIEGPWRPHPLNPVKIDARSARPAGRMWVDSDGALMRPVQDCSTIYGGSIRLQRVVALDEARFEEVDLGPLSTPNELAESRFHTYNSEESLQVVDVLRRLPRGRSQAAAEVDHGAAQ